MITLQPHCGFLAAICHRAALAGMLVASGASTAAAIDSAEIQRRQQQMKAEMDRKVAQQKRQFEAKSQAIKADQQKLQQKVADGLAKIRAGSSESAAPPFDPAGAPPPTDCLKAYLAAARGASSMEQVLPFLRLREQQVLKDQQARYDPQQAAKSRAWHKKQDPGMKEESLTFLSNPPYTNALKWHKGVAERILGILSVRTDGDKASITVSTKSGATINGETYPYSTADIELLGEGNYWHFSKYESSIVYYKEPPTKP